MKGVWIKMKKGLLRLRQFFGNLTEAPIRWYDFAILGALMLFCFLSCTMRDIVHTAGCSYGYLDGHIFDFYDYLSASGIDENGLQGLHASYMPSVYLLFAIWNIPMKLFGVVPKATAVLGVMPILWAKILPCLAFFGSAFAVFLIARELGMSDHKAKIVMYAYLSMPVALYGQFILGQYESFVVLCVLFGVYAWLKKKTLNFVVWFAVALSFKITALLFFLPLLLLREKNIWKILMWSAAVFALYALEFLIYYHSPAFLSYAFGIGSAGDNPTGYIFNAAYFTGFILTENLKYEVYLTVLAFAFICAYAYFKKTWTGEEGRYAMYLLCLTGAALFAFSKWHPHWLMIVVPFWTLTAFMHRDSKIWMALDLLFTALLIMFCTCQFIGVCDEVMLSRGIFKFALPNGAATVRLQMSELLGRIDMSLELSLITALILIYAVFKHPKFMTADADASVDASIGWIRARYIVGLAVFILPLMGVLFSSVGDQKTVYLEEVRAFYVYPEERGDFTVSQTFVSDGTISKVKFPVSMGDRTKEGLLKVSILSESGVRLYQETFDMKDFYEGKIVMMKPKLKSPKGETLKIVFETSGLKKDATFALLGNEGGDFDAAELNGEAAAYHLDINIYR